MKSKIVVGIHQPNFFPWMGFFDKIVKSDVFVLLDDVQFQKTGGNWTNRVKMISANGASWETVPIDRSGSGFRKVNEVQFKDFERWRLDFLQSISFRYRKFPWYSETLEVLERIVATPTQFLAEFNSQAIKVLCEVLGLDREVKVSSSFGLSSSSSLRLCELVRRVGGTAYLIGSGSAGYVDMEVFETQGIEVIPQDFTHPTYPQIGQPQFVSGLSMIDALMSGGSKSVRLLAQV